MIAEISEHPGIPDEVRIHLWCIYSVVRSLEHELQRVTRALDEIVEDARDMEIAIAKEERSQERVAAKRDNVVALTDKNGRVVRPGDGGYLREALTQSLEQINNE